GLLSAQVDLVGVEVPRHDLRRQPAVGGDGDGLGGAVGPPVQPALTQVGAGAALHAGPIGAEQFAGEVVGQARDAQAGGTGPFPPAARRDAVRNAMLAPTPNGGSGYRALCRSSLPRPKAAGVNPRPLLCPPNCSNHSCSRVTSSAGTTRPDTASASGRSAIAR